MVKESNFAGEAAIPDGTSMVVDVRCYEEIMMATGRSAGREGLDLIMERVSNWIESI